MMRLTKRALSAFLAFVMVFTMLPLDVWAEGSQTSGNMVSVADSYEKASDNQTLELDSASTVIAVEGTHTFNASLKSEDGTTTSLDGSACEWTSSKKDVATVEGGVVTGVGVGTAQITCTYSGLETFAMVTVTEANYRLVYQSAYPDGAMKYTYENGKTAKVEAAKDTPYTETYQPGATATVKGDIFTTINYQLTHYTDSDGNVYYANREIQMDGDLTLTAQWEPKEIGSATEQTIIVRYILQEGWNNPLTYDAEVSAMVSESEEGGYRTATVTFLTGNLQDTIAQADKSKYFNSNLCGWTIGGTDYDYNQQVTTTTWEKYGGRWLVKAYAYAREAEDDTVAAQFFVRKLEPTGDFTATGNYYSVGTGVVLTADLARDNNGDIAKGTVAGSTSKVNGTDVDDVNQNVDAHIESAPTAAEIANLMNVTLEEASSVRWYVIKNQRDGFHVDGFVYVKDKYWKVEFVDPDSGDVVLTLLVEDSSTINADDVEVGTNLNTNLRTFKGWSTKEDGESVDITSTPILQDTTFYATFTRYSGYKVEYYLQNADNDEYTLDEGRSYTEKKAVNETVEITPKPIGGYAFKQEGSITSGTVKEGETLILKLYYDRIKYDVTYEYEGSTIPDGADEQLPETTQYKQGATVTVENEPVVTGYQFSGWRVQKPSSGVTIIDGEFTMPNQNVTLVGSWERIIYNGETITIKVIKDGEKVAANDYFTPQNYNNGTEGFQYTLDGLEYKVDFTYDNLNCADIYLPLETPEGYTVQIASNDNGPTIGVLDDVQRPLEIDEDENGWILDNVPGGATVTVTLVPNSHTVSYKYTDQSGNEHVFKEPVNRYFGTTVQVSTDVPQAPAGYHFSGWTTDDAEVTNDSFTMPDNDVVFVGSFIANDNTHYQVQWYYQNADGSYPTTTSVTENRYGTTGTEATVTDADKAETQNGLYVYNSDKSTEKSTITGDGSTVLKLYFDRAEFDVKYEYSNEVDGAPSPPEEQDYKWGTTGIQVETAPTLEGYVFSGWTTTDAKVENGSFTMPQQDVTFTGSWTKLYTVTYNPNGGVGNPHIVDVKDGEDHTVLDNTETDFTKTNYHFVGWNAQADGSGKSYLKDEVISGISSNITLYAQWEIDKVAYTIEYYLDGNPVESPYAGAPTGDSADIDTEVDVRTMQGYRTSFGETGSHYVLDEGAENVFEITINADTTQNVLKVYYASDNKGGEEDPDTPDEIPDKDQVIFRYVADSNGSITGKTHETITKTDDVTTAQPTGTTVRAADGYKFLKWTRTGDPTEDITEEMTAFKSISYSWGSDVTFTVHFTKRTDLEYTINYYWVGDKDNQSRIPIRNPETKSDGTLGDTVTLSDIPSIDGYTLVPHTYQVTISANEAANVINVYYYKNVTLTANSDTNRVYTGTVQTITGFTVTGEVDDVKAEFTGVSASGSGTDANTDQNPFYEVGFTGVTVNETLDDTGCYIVTQTVPGKLIINPATMNLTVEGYDDFYDGAAHGGTVRGYPDGAELLYSTDGGENWSKEAPTVTDYTENPVAVQVKVTLANYNDQTATYTLNVKKRPVTLVSEGATREYNGLALTNANWSYDSNEYEFVADEVTNIRTTGTQTEIGSSKNTIAYDKSDGFKESNYQITIREGDLVVTPPQNPNKYDVVTKTHDKNNLNPDEIVTFTIKVKNIFADTATVTLNELPGVSFSENGTNELIFQLNGGETKEVKATYTITEADVLAGKFVNTVSATLVVGDQTVEASATDTVTLKAAPALTVDKTVTSRPTNGSTYALGETITWSITVTNSGNVGLEEVQVSDRLTYQGDKSGETLSGTLTAPDGFDGTLGRGESVIYTYSYQVTEGDLGKFLVNAATATGKDSNGNEATPVSDEADPVQTDYLNPGLSVTKKADKTSAVVGDTINYTITVTNTGNQTLNNIKVIDPLTNLTQTIGELKPGDTSEAFKTSYTVKVSDLIAGSVVNTATAEAGNVTAEARKTVAITGSLNISVTLNSGEFTYDGQEHTVSGIKSVTYGNDVILVNNGTFKIGDTTFTLSCAEGKGTATGTDVVRNPDGTVGSYPVTAQPTDITVKMGGQNVTGKVTVTNVTAGSLQINPRKVTITVQDAEKTYGESDPTPFQAVLSGDPLVNDTDLGTITCSRTNEDEDADVYEGVLTASYTDNKNYDVTVVNGDFTIKKYTLPVVVTIEGTSAEKPYTGSEQSVEGYTITGITVNGVESELYPEASVQFVGEPYDKVASGTYVGEYSMALNKDDFENGNANFTNVTFQVTPGKLTITPGTYQPVTKTHEEKQDGSKFALNETVTFPITVVNIYNTPAKVTLTEQEGVFFEGGSRTAEQVLGPGDKMIFNAYYVITEQDILNESFTNTVEWTIARIDDSEKITGTAADTVEVVAKAPKLTVSKTVKNSVDAPFDLNETITYTITVKNDGNVTVTGINVADLVTTEGENRQAATVNAEAFALKPGEDKSFEYTYKVQQSDLGKTILNTATATGSDPTGEEVVGTDDVEAETEERNPELDVTKVASKPANGTEFVLDETITYTITVKNTGNVTLADIFVSDEFSRDDGATWDVQKDKLTPSASTPITLEPGEQKIYTYQYTVVEEDLGKTLKNTATATAPNPDDPSQSVTDGATTPGEKVEDPKPDLSVTKEVVNKQTSYRVGDVITYKITVNNTGNTTLHNLSLVDSMNAAGKVTFTDLGGGTQNGSSVTLASLTPKAIWTVTCTYKVQLADADSDGNVISNEVVVTSDEGPDDDAETPGEKIDPIYTLTIKYQNGARVDLRDPDTVKLHAGDVYTVVAPGINGYHLSDKAYAEFDFTMRDRDTTIVIIYAANPVEEDDDEPVVNPDNDPDETTEETEDEVDPGVYIEDPDDYTLTPITEEEPPLADLDVGDHTCCIMHFLLMLAAMVVLGFYTDSKKKHQARIFELKRTLAMEKGKNPDGDNSQQS